MAIGRSPELRLRCLRNLGNELIVEVDVEVCEV